MNAQHEDYTTALERAAKVIDAADCVTLLCHVNPDGDALGSMLGMHHALRAAGRASVASFPEPFVIAPHYRDLPGLDSAHPPDVPGADPPVVVTFDCGALGRLGNLRAVGEQADELIVVDHHVSNERYGTINVIDPRAAASWCRRPRPHPRAGPADDARERVLSLHRARVRHRAGSSTRPRRPRSSRSPASWSSGTCRSRRSAARCSRSTRSRTSRCSARRSRR